ncbi:MAG TPA: hypothetical protein VMV71_03675 [Candidatus Paceibacterota bacterium]|nr:hypothetical protein [Candidatus Paceibacterota bacterium]
MAIFVEEKSDSGVVVNIIIWIAILVIISVSIYYIFFNQPQLVEFTGSQSFQNIQQLSKISINSDKLINNQAFQALKPYITVAQPDNLGKSNPFLGF